MRKIPPRRRIKLLRAKLAYRQIRCDRYTAKWLTIKTNVCPVWGLRARAAMRAEGKL